MFGLFTTSTSRNASRWMRLQSRLRVEELERRDVPSTLGLDDLAATPAVDFSPLVTNPTVYGLTPAKVRKAYGFDTIKFANGTITGDGSGQTIAIVDAYDNPNIWSDLLMFDRTFGIADPPRFTKVTPQGTPGIDAGWAMETALDVEWAHALAPKANILLVEAKTSGLGDLLGAVNVARNTPGVVTVSMSWGAGEFWSETYYDTYFTTPAGHIGGSNLAGGITFVASSGDSGARSGAEWPAVSPNVLAVGGTKLNIDSTGAYASETGWSGSGGGVSAYESAPSYQSGLTTNGKRVGPDVSYDADPSSGFAVYDTVAYAGRTGWFQVGGTSAGTPQWAALVAIADQGRALAGKGSLSNAQSLVYGLPSSDFHDVTSGNNGYSAKAGFDLVTGRGSPFADRVVSHLVNGVTQSSSQSTTTAGNTGKAGAFGRFAVQAGDGTFTDGDTSTQARNVFSFTPNTTVLTISNTTTVFNPVNGPLTGTDTTWTPLFLAGGADASETDLCSPWDSSGSKHGLASADDTGLAEWDQSLALVMAEMRA